MTATNNLPLAPLADSVLVNYQGNTRRLLISVLAEIIGGGGSGPNSSLAAEIVARGAADDAILSEVRNGRVFASSASNVSSVSPPEGTDRLLTSAGGSVQYWVTSNAPADGVATDTVQKDATGQWWSRTFDGRELTAEASARASADAAESVARQRLEGVPILRQSIHGGPALVEVAGLDRIDPLRIVRTVDVQGVTRQITPEGGRPVLRWSLDSAPALVDVDAAGRIFGRLGYDGIWVFAAQSGPATQGDTLLGIAGGKIIATDGIAPAAQRPEDVAARVGLPDPVTGHYQAALSRPGLGQFAAVSAVLGGAHHVPDHDRLLHVIIVQGQSNAYSWGWGPNITVAPPHPDRMLQIDRGLGTSSRIADGVGGGAVPPVLDPAVMTGFKPLSAVPWQDPATAAAYRAIALADQAHAPHRLLVINGAASGFGYADLAEGTVPFENTITAATRAAELAQAMGWRVVFPAVICAHGEADRSAVTYGDMLIAWQEALERRLRAISGQVAGVPMYLSQPSNFFESYNSSRSARAMLALHEANLEQPVHLRKFIAIGPIYQHQWSEDYLHLTGRGHADNGWTFGDALADGLWGLGWDCLRITGGTVSSATLDLTYHVPRPPLVIDPVAAVDRLGFQVWDGAVEIAVTGAVVVAPNTIRLTLATAPTGVVRVDYALLGHGAERGAGTIPRGAVRDSAGLSRTIPGGADPLHNWAVHQSRSL